MLLMIMQMYASDPSSIGWSHHPYWGLSMFVLPVCHCTTAHIRSSTGLDRPPFSPDLSADSTAVGILFLTLFCSRRTAAKAYSFLQDVPFTEEPMRFFSLISR